MAAFEGGPANCHGELLLASDAAMFRDHFPGQPLLPAIGLIHLCEILIRHWLGDATRLQGLRRGQDPETLDLALNGLRQIARQWDPQQMDVPACD